MKLLLIKQDCDKEFIISIEKQLRAEVVLFDDLVKDDDTFYMDMFLIYSEDLNFIQELLMRNELRSKLGIVFSDSALMSPNRELSNVKVYRPTLIPFEIEEAIDNVRNGSENCNFIKFNLSLLDKLKTPTFDIYFKISDSKYLKLFNKNENLQQNRIDSYRQRGIGELYLEKSHYPDYIACLEKIKSDNKNTKTGEKEISARYMSAIELAKAVGINERTIEEINTLVEGSIKKLSSSNKNLFVLLDKMVSGKNYLYEHSLMLSYISCQMAINISWNSKSTLEKLAMASLLHDIMLDDPKLAAITDINDKRTQSHHNWQELKRVSRHPVEAAELISSSRDLPLDLESIVRNHHEKPDGSGFPRGLNSSNIAPISCIFIIAENCVNLLFEKELNFEKGILSEVYQEMKPTYRKGNFKKPFEALEKLIDSTK